MLLFVLHETLDSVLLEHGRAGIDRSDDLELAGVAVLVEVLLVLLELVVVNALLVVHLLEFALIGQELHHVLQARNIVY